MPPSPSVANSSSTSSRVRTLSILVPVVPIVPTVLDVRVLARARAKPHSLSLLRAMDHPYHIGVVRPQFLEGLDRLGMVDGGRRSLADDRALRGGAVREACTRAEITHG